MLNSGTATIDYAEITHSSYGVSGYSSNSPEITNSEFAETDVKAIYLGGTTGSPVVTGNTLDIDGGTGIECSRGTVSENTITGDGDSLDGILVSQDGDVTIEDNTVSGLTNGNALAVEQGYALVKENSLLTSKRGVYVTGGSLDIGTTTSGTGNTIRSHTTGIYVRCSGPGTTCKSCMNGEDVVIRRNTIRDSGYGVTVEKVDQDPVVVDIGTDTEYGNNSLLNNVV